MKKTVVIVAGPTAAGKTAIAVQMARHFNTSIISADSRQCYRELNIGVAKPSEAELAASHHYFINSHSIHQPVDAALYEQYALQSAAEIFADRDMAVVVGGTGLYIKALCEGVDKMPDIPDAIRAETRSRFSENGIGWLQMEMERLDPLFYASGEIHNPHRMLRALEFFYTTGESIRTYQKGIKTERPFDIIKIGLQVPKEELHLRINKRVDEMVAMGLVDEVRDLLPYQHLKALQTVGYRELFDYLNGIISLEAAIELIKRNTRQYAKRQNTWFRKDIAFQMFAPESYEEMIAFINHSQQKSPE